MSSDLYPDLLAFSESDVYEILSTLDSTKSIGPDGIGPAVLKYCADALAQPLCWLFHISIRTAYFRHSSGRVILLFLFINLGISLISLTIDPYLLT